jgi:hypothetical protein
VEIEHAAPLRVRYGNQDVNGNLTAAHLSGRVDGAWRAPAAYTSPKHNNPPPNTACRQTSDQKKKGAALRQVRYVPANRIPRIRPPTHLPKQPSISPADYLATAPLPYLVSTPLPSPQVLRPWLTPLLPSLFPPPTLLSSHGAARSATMHAHAHACTTGTDPVLGEALSKAHCVREAVLAAAGRKRRAGEKNG